MWTVRLSDKQLEVLKALIAEQDHIGPALSRSLESLELARWDELPEAQLPWSDVTKVASEQQVSEADVVWDLCGKRARHRADEPTRAERRDERAAPKRKRAA